MMNALSTLNDSNTVATDNRTHSGQKKKWRRLKKAKSHKPQQQRKLVDVLSLGLKGATEDLDGWVITYPGEHKNLRQDQFRDIVDNIANYVYKKCQYPEDLTCFFEDFERKDISKPDDPEDDPSLTDKTIWEAEVK